MIDSHCHLTDPRLGSQLAGVLQRAAAAGVERMVTIGTNLTDSRECVTLCRTVAAARCAIGLHPNYVTEAELETVGAFRDLAADPAVVALGEMGLDYFHETAPKALQQVAFERQLQTAVDLGRAVVIHCREAIDDCLAVMRGFASVKAVFHCFTGSPEEARKILDAGYLLGFTGAVTFKKNDSLREALRLVPPERILVETDAPYLTPEPMRKQKVNEPAMVIHVAATVGRVKGLSPEETDRITTDNTLRFFSWT